MLIYDGFDEVHARAWVHESLSTGHRISAAVLEAFRSDIGRVGCFVPDGVPLPLRAIGRRGPHDLDLGHCWMECIGGDWQNSGRDQDLDLYVAKRHGDGDRGVVVEDEMARRRDLAVGSWGRRLFVFVDDHLVHYGGLGDEPVSEMFTEATFGYPTNAFLVRSDPAVLGLESEATLDASGIERIVAAIDVVVVAAFDAESYVVWELS